MKAIRVKNMQSRPQITLADLPKPEIGGPEQVLVRVLCVGLDGTDREILTQHYGRAPQGEQELTTGHESLGVVEQAGPASGLAPGDLVTALVRRPCRDPRCVNCRNDRSDFCETGEYVERGINGAHGYLAEYYVEEARYVVKMPADCLPFGMLAEPQSIVEKVWNQVQHVQQRLIWEPQTAIVLGAGPLGILAAATCRLLGLETCVWSKGANTTPQAGLIQEIGGRYQQADAADGDAPRTLSEFVSRLDKRPDLIMECTGYSPLAVEAMETLGPNGVLALLGVTPGHHQLTIDSNALNEKIVLENKCIVGSVNAARKDFETGIYRLSRMNAQFPGLPDKLITERLRLEDLPHLDFAKIGIKAVVDVVPQEQWGGLVHPGKEVQYSFSV